MDSYYYPVSALPGISFDSDSPLTEERFLEQILPWITGKDAVLIKAIKDGKLTEGRNQILDSWNRWNISLKNELVKLRAGKLGIDNEKYQREGGGLWYLQEKAREIFLQESPLTAEIAILKEQWDYLTELELGHYFDIEILIIYFLKLRILVKKNYYRSATGRTNFEELYRIINVTQSEFRAGE